MSAQSMRSSYTHSLSLDQVSLLQSLLLERGWEFLKKEHTIFSARQGKVSVSVYHKGPKILVQGKGFEEFVEFILEPEVLRSADKALYGAKMTGRNKVVLSSSSAA